LFTVVLLLSNVFVLGISGAYDSLFVIGDSLTDVGNFASISPGHWPFAPYSPGRFSNGIT